MLTPADAARVANIVVAGLAAEALLLPFAQEREPVFTARVLMPIVQRVLKEVDISGITLHGDGRSSAPSTSLPSCEFKPDIALLYHRKRMVAFEVKFLRSSGRQASLSAAIGQAVVYRSQGYGVVGIILIDLAPTRGEAAAIEKMLRRLHFLPSIFSRSGTKLLVTG